MTNLRDLTKADIEIMIHMARNSMPDLVHPFFESHVANRSDVYNVFAILGGKPPRHLSFSRVLKALEKIGYLPLLMEWFTAYDDEDDDEAEQPFQACHMFFNRASDGAMLGGPSARSMDGAMWATVLTIAQDIVTE